MSIDVIMMAKLHGNHSSEFVLYYSQLIDQLNCKAMTYLQCANYEYCYQLLSWCDEMTISGRFGNFFNLRVLTFNNLACLSRQTGKLQLALNYLNQAIAILTQAKSMNSSTPTYLNLCAVLSQAGK